MRRDNSGEAATGRSPATGSPVDLSQAVSAEPLTSTSSKQASATRYDLQVLKALRRIIRAVDLHSRKLSAQHNITGPQLVCLLAVEEHESMTGGVIARHVHLSSSTVNGILDRLEAKGLVWRERDLKDRRLVHVSLTEPGKMLVKSAPSPLQDTLREAMNELSEAEQATIGEVLDQIVEMMEVQNIDAAPILEAGPIDLTTEEAKAVEPPGGGSPAVSRAGARPPSFGPRRVLRGDTTSYDTLNEAKANFDDAYTAPTPHAYIASMAENGYEIGEQARPYCVAAAELLREHNGDVWPVQMLDVGCSYGIGSALVKYGCSFDEMVAFFASRAPREYQSSCEAMRAWLNVGPPARDIRAVGLDSSEPAIRFAVDAGLLDGGFARDFERPDVAPTEEDSAWFRSCNLLISTGAIGYITERTLDVVLRHLGKGNPGDFGPFAVVTILRMFDVSPIETVFEKHGFTFGTVPGVRLPQRRFTDAEERQKVLSLLHDRGIDTRDWEDRGEQYADLFIAAPPQQFSLLLERMSETRSERDGESDVAGHVCR